MMIVQMMRVNVSKYLTVFEAVLESADHSYWSRGEGVGRVKWNY